MAIGDHAGSNAGMTEAGARNAGRYEERRATAAYMPCEPRFMAAMPVRQTSIRPSGLMIATN